MAEDSREEIFSGYGILEESLQLEESSVSEEDLVNSLFYLCNPEKLSCIPASRIIDFMRVSTGLTEDKHSGIEELASSLDPEHLNVQIDKETCREKVTMWIERMKRERGLEDLSIYAGRSQKSGNLEDQFHLLETSLRQKFEGGDFLRPSEVIIADLNHEIELAKSQKKKLGEENARLLQQLVSAEENGFTLAEKLKEATKEIKSLQEIVKVREEIAYENNNLKATISCLEEKRLEQSVQLKQLEKLNNSLQDTIMDRDQKLDKAKNEIIDLENQLGEFQSVAVRHKHLWTKTQEEKDIVEARLNEKSKQVDELYSSVESFKKINNDLHGQKEELQLQLSDVQQQLNSIQKRAEKFGVPDSLLNSEDEPGPTASSTPKDNKGVQKSLGFEIREKLVGENGLDSPLVGREWDDSIVMKLWKSPISNNYQMPEDLNHTLSTDDITNLSTSVMSDVIRRHEELVKKVEDLYDARDNLPEPSTEIRTTVKEDLEFFINKITLLTGEKKSTEQRAKKLVLSCKKLKDENLRLRRINGKSIPELNFSISSEQTFEDSVKTVKGQLEERKNTIRQLEEELSSVKSELSNLHHENLQFKRTIKEFNEEKTAMTVEIKCLKLNNLEVAQKVQKSELKSQQLSEEIKNYQSTVSEEQKRCKQLEENLSQCKTEHQVDLQEIWKVVQKEVAKDQRLEQEEVLKSTESLKGQVAKEIGTLKCQLYKTQAAFTKLKQKTRQLQLPLGKCELKPECSSRLNDRRPSSPLVDALTIDFFNGTTLLRKNSRNSQTLTSVGEVLFGAGNPRVPVCCQDLAVSCPSLTSQHELVTSATQTEEYSQTNLNASNSSSTSGVLDLDMSSGSIRSLDGRVQRKNFQRFPRFDSDSQTSQSMESNTDADGSFPLQRSPSFLAAIEGQKYDRSNQDYGLNRTYNTSSVIENHIDGQTFPRSRSSSFQAAIESGQKSPTDEQCNLQSTIENTIDNNNTGEYTSPDWENMNNNTNNNNFQTSDHRIVSFITLPNYNNNFDNDQDYSEDKRFSPIPARKLSTLIEEDMGEWDNSQDVGIIQENCKRIPLESSFHENGRVLTTFADVHQRPVETSHTNHSLPPQYSSIKCIRLDNNLPRRPSPTPRCSVKKASQEVSFSSHKGPSQAGSVSPRGQTAHSSLPHNQGSQSPLLSEKSSLIAKAKREKHLKAQQTPPSSCLKKSFVENGFHSNENGVRKNLDKLFDEDDSEHNKEKKHSTNKLQINQGEEYQGGECGEIEVRGVSPKGKTSPLTRHPSIHEDSSNDDKFHKFPVLVDSSEDLSSQSHHVEHTDQCSPSSPSCRVTMNISLAQTREGHLSKRREDLIYPTMPEISELAETSQNVEKSNEPKTPSTPVITGKGDTPLKNPAYPSLPDNVLRSLGLFKDSPQSNEQEQLTNQEIEEKFARLALAFKTDKLTLDKRLSIQQRSRDVAEQNVETEMQGLKKVIVSLSQLCDKPEMMELIKALQHHQEVLEQSTIRVSSRAEVYGAVQQESRMSKSIDVMIKHVENLKVLFDKEHSELEEAKKFLQDNGVHGSLNGSDFGSFDGLNLSRRATSVGGNISLKNTRRRNSVSVLPKILGGGGTPFNLSPSKSMEDSSDTDNFLNRSFAGQLTDRQDPKTRFQCAIANTTVRSAVTGALRRASLDNLSKDLPLNLSQQSVIGKTSSPDKREQGVQANLDDEMSMVEGGRPNMWAKAKFLPKLLKWKKFPAVEKAFRLWRGWERVSIGGVLLLMTMLLAVFTLCFFTLESQCSFFVGAVV